MHDYQSPGRSVAFAREAMCCTSHSFAARTALEILKDGGNAVDAAVAGAAVLGFCEPMMTGLGGDVFAMMRLPEDGRVVGLNGSGRAPQGLDADILRTDGHVTIPTESVHAITVPGAVDAFSRLIKDYGRLDLAEVLSPAIRYAEEGVPVCHRSALDWTAFGDRLWGPGRSHFLRNGSPYRAGEIFASPAQAEALRLIARDGRDAFYHGPIADDMLETLQSVGGLHTASDFDAAASDRLDPISTTYKGYELLELPPNGQGATALLILNLLTRLGADRFPPDSAERIHLQAEATRLAYAERNRFIGDPETVGSGYETMLSAETADRLAATIDPTRAGPKPEAPGAARHRDTVYICVVDRDRLCVSLIYSTFWPFGSGLASKRFGISFQNRGAGFCLEPGHVNELAGGKRPLHTLIPGFLTRGASEVMPFGVMGGPYQAAGHAHLVSNIADYGMDLQEAIDCPRSFADPVTGQLTLENGFSDAVAAKLAEMGHDVVRPPVGIGGAQAILADLETGLLTGGSDQRKDGVALGM